jgi:PmbA protein
MPSPSRSLSPSDFAYSRDRFRELVDGALATAKSLGASDAVAEVSEGVGLSVSVRKGETENVERNRDKSISITVYAGQRRGNASSSDFSPAAIEQTVRAAWDIARFTAEDSAAGLPDADGLATGEAATRDLDLFHPWAIDAEGAIALALECEAAALAVDRRITNSEGAGVSAQQSHFYAANTRGFGAGYASSRHSLSVAPIASLPGRNGDDMQRDAWYTSMRSADELAAPAAVGRYAAERALSRLGSRKIRTREVPVLYESSLASGLLGAYVHATSGGALYRKSSFPRGLPGQAGPRRAPRPARGPPRRPRQGQRPLRRRGRADDAARHRVGGVAESYFLSTYSARKLGMKTTGHAGGSHNLTLSSRLTRAGDDLEAMLRKLGRGLFVIELMGQGVNYVTGDYSRGAAGFWVEGGKIAYPVHEITIAGNLRDMFLGSVAVGADAYTMGSKTDRIVADRADEDRRRLRPTVRSRGRRFRRVSPL